MKVFIKLLDKLTNRHMIRTNQNNLPQQPNLKWLPIVINSSNSYQPITLSTYVVDQSPPIGNQAAVPKYNADILAMF